MILETSANINSIIWIINCHENEIGASRRIIGDLEINLYDVNIEVYSPKSMADLTELLNSLLVRVIGDNLKPIIHIDMHGDKSKGLYLTETNEFAPWSYVADWFRYINIALKNNLIVLSTACYSFYLITQVQLPKPTPCFVYIAPENKLSIGFISDNILNFYRTLFNTLSIDDAYDHFSKKLKYYHCDKTLFLAIAKYVKNNCQGKAGRKRIENILTQVVTSDSYRKEKSTLKDARQRIKQNIKPNQELLNN